MVSGHRATRKRHCHPGKLGHSASPVGSFASSSLFPFPSPCPKELLLGYNDMKITLLRTCLLIILFTLLRLLFLLLVSLVFLLLLLLLGDGNLPGPVVHVQPQQLPHVVYGLLAVLEPQLSPLLSLLINSYSFSKIQLIITLAFSGAQGDEVMRASSALPALKYSTTWLCSNLVFLVGTFFLSQLTTLFCSFVNCSFSSSFPPLSTLPRLFFLLSTVIFPYS